MYLRISTHTLEPVYRDHPKNQVEVAFVDRWLQGGPLRTGGPYIEVVFNYRFNGARVACTQSCAGFGCYSINI